MFGFIRDDTYDNCTHAKILTGGPVQYYGPMTQTVYVEPTSFPTMVVYDMTSREDIPSSVEDDVAHTLEALGFKYVDGSPIVNDDQRHRAQLIYIHEAMEEKAFLALLATGGIDLSAYQT